MARHCRALVRCASRGSEELTTGSATYVRHYDRVIIHRKYELEVAYRFSGSFHQGFQKQDPTHRAASADLGELAKPSRPHARGCPGLC